MLVSQFKFGKIVVGNGGSPFAITGVMWAADGDVWYAGDDRQWHLEADVNLFQARLPYVETPRKTIFRAETNTELAARHQRERDAYEAMESVK